MDLNPIAPAAQTPIQDRGTRRGVPATESSQPPAPSPSNGMPPPVGDVIVLSQAGRAQFEAWESRQGWTGYERRSPSAAPAPEATSTPQTPAPEPAAPSAPEA